MNKERGIVKKYSLGVREIEPRKLTKQQKKDFKQASDILNAGINKGFYPSKPNRSNLGESLW